ncbi:MAG: hydrogenase maturation protease [Pseudomonadota bacterium]
MAAREEFLIVGVGNPHRRDDGIGPYVIRELCRIFEERKAVRLLDRFQLGPDLIEDLRHARLIVLVDAAVKDLKEGREWSRVRPEYEALPYLTHHVPPRYLLWLLKSVYGRSPTAWQVTIQGKDFGHGRGLSPFTKKKGREVMREIVDLYTLR